MKEDIERFIAESRQKRLDALVERLLSRYDRSPESLTALGWELEEELNEELYASLDAMGWSPSALAADFSETQQWLTAMLERFEELEEYECCVMVREAQGWLAKKCELFLREIDGGADPADLIGV